MVHTGWFDIILVGCTTRKKNGTYFLRLHVCQFIHCFCNIIKVNETFFCRHHNLSRMMSRGKLIFTVVHVQGFVVEQKFKSY